jgi:hypothetical protein
MATFVNYYPCSYGDTFVAMFSGQKIQRKDNLIITQTNDLSGTFKQMDFYQQDTETKKHQLGQLPDGIYSCHRQKQFDFSPHTVVSIRLDVNNFLPLRFRDVHIQQLKLAFENPLIEKLGKKFTFEQLVIFDYTRWSRDNILPTDIELPISLVHDKPKLKNFCLENNFEFDEEQVDELVGDMEKYQ